MKVRSIEHTTANQLLCDCGIFSGIFHNRVRIVRAVGDKIAPRSGHHRPSSFNTPKFVTQNSLGRFPPKCSTEAIEVELEP